MKHNYSLRSLIYIFIGLKFFLLLAAWLAWQSGLYCAVCTTDPVSSFVDVLLAWDAGIYLHLSEYGYQLHPYSFNAFFPLWPAAIHAGTWILRSSFASGMVLAKALSLGAMALGYDLLRRLYSKKVAWLSVLLLLLFPTAFFYSLPYSESLFLFLVLLGFWTVHTGRTRWLLLAGLLLPLSRPQGFLLWVPLVLTVLQFSAPGRKRQQLLGQLTLAFTVGGLIYLWIMYTTAGSPLAGLYSQDLFIGDGSLLHAIDLRFWLQQITPPHSIHLPTDSWFDWLSAWGLVAVLPLVATLKHRGFFAYVALLGLFPVFTTNLFGYPRYLAVLFPIFLALTLWSKQRWWMIAAVFGAFQVILAVLHMMHYWVS